MDRHTFDASRVRGAQAQVQNTQRILQSELQVGQSAAVAREQYKPYTTRRA